MNIDFFSDLADEIHDILRGWDMPIPSYEQLRKQDKRSDEITEYVK